MNYRLLLIITCGVLNACAPTSQIGVLNDQKNAMDQIDLACKNQLQKPEITVAMVQCRFNGYEALLKANNFKDMDLFYVLRDKYMNAAQQFDSKEITVNEEDILLTIADGNFVSALDKRDHIRYRNFQKALLAATSSMNQISQYNQAPMPAFAPVSQPAMAPSIMAPVDNTFQNNYVHESQQLTPPTPAEHLYDCAQTASCAGAFSPYATH